MPSVVSSFHGRRLSVKKEYQMKFNLVIDIDLPESDQIKMCNDMIGFFQDRLTIAATENAVCSVLSAVPLKELYISECGFPETLIRHLNNNDIYYIYDFNNYKLSQIYNMLNRKFCYEEVKKFLSLIHNAMKKYRLSYADKNIDSMIPLDECGMSARTVNSLTRAGYVYIQDIAFHTRDEIRKTRNFGTVSRQDLEQKMIEYGIWYSDK